MTEENETPLIPYFIRLSKGQSDALPALRGVTGQRDNTKLIRFALSELAARHYIEFPMDVASAGRKHKPKC